MHFHRRCHYFQCKKNWKVELNVIHDKIRNSSSCRDTFCKPFILEKLCHSPRVTFWSHFSYIETMAHIQISLGDLGMTYISNGWQLNFATFPQHCVIWVNIASSGGSFCLVRINHNLASWYIQKIHKDK